MRRLLLAPVLLCAIVLASCSSGGTSATSSTTTTQGTTRASSASHNATTTVPAATAAKVPAVATPTDLTTAPVVSPGTPPPPTTLVTKDLVVGSGPTATKSSTVLVKYVGADYTTGKNFTTQTWTSGKPTSFPLDGVVPGFAEGIEGMKVGGRREIVIPPALGYGASGSGGAVGPNETLVFVVDLKGVS